MQANARPPHPESAAGLRLPVEGPRTAESAVRATARFTSPGTGFPRHAEIDQPDLTAAGDVGPNGVRPRTSAAGPCKVVAALPRCATCFPVDCMVFCLMELTKKRSQDFRHFVC
jgi:hypothetical protein